MQAQIEEKLICSSSHIVLKVSVDLKAKDESYAVVNNADEFEGF